MDTSLCYLCCELNIYPFRNLHLVSLAKVYFLFVVTPNARIQCQVLLRKVHLSELFQGPFTTFKVENEAKEDWTGLKFSPDGKMIMITTNGSTVTLIDSFKGTPIHVLRGLFSSFDKLPWAQNDSYYFASSRKF